MSASGLVCQNEQRRHEVRKTTSLNGLDYLEVSDDQLTLEVYFLGKAPPLIEKENIRIEGGRRITNIHVLDIEIFRNEDPEADDCLTVSVDKPGDFSPYRLRLIEIDAQTKQALTRLDAQGSLHYLAMAGIDPRYDSLEFSFKASCPSDLDCKNSPVCPPEKCDAPPIDYLAKDYASFRQLMLDRMALTLPDWKERHVPDLGVTLVELLAYAGDHISYYQDAVATEAYLDTARRRTSVRRHLRLVDYQLHEGCNARALVSFKVSVDTPELQAKDFYLTTDPGVPALGNVVLATDLPQTQPKHYLVFEPLPLEPGQPIIFRQAQNEIQIYTWGDEECCLPKGTVSATLLDPGIATGTSSETTPAVDSGEKPMPFPLATDYQLKLKPSDILIFEEVIGPKTGNPADADPKHRHAVRLTKAEPSQDPLTGKLIWDIAWATGDALPFALCLSSIKQDDCSLISGVSVVRGNVLLVDQGETVSDELPEVPVEIVLAGCGCDCSPREEIKIPGRYTPSLSNTDITYSQPLPAYNSGAPSFKQKPINVLLQQDVRKALPVVHLQVSTADFEGPKDWQPQLDLLASGPDDPYFVLETEDDRRAKLRFGNGESGREPEAGVQFKADYRIGNGAIGNVGPESITRLVFRNTLLSGVTVKLRNPLPAMGGTDPEPIQEAKLFGPDVFRRELQRAVTADDYARIVMRDFADRVQRAAAKLRWTGSWFEVLVAIDPLGTEDTDTRLLKDIERHLYRFRRIGHDVVVVQAAYVPLDIAMKVCVLPNYLRGHIKAALLEVFSGRTLPDGSKGFFHPDNLTFGDGVYLSQLVAKAQAIQGVESVVVTKLERLFLGPNKEIDNGLLPLGSFEVARLDNDPSFPEHGKFTLDIGGGR